MTENSILGSFHKDAKAAYDSGQSLHYICSELTTSTAKFNDEVRKKEIYANFYLIVLCSTSLSFIL